MSRIEDQIDEIQSMIRDAVLEKDTKVRNVTKHRKRIMAELEALLLAVQDEQIMKCRIKAKKRLLEQNERLRDMVQDFSIQMKACSVSAQRATEALEEFGKQIKLKD